MKSSIKIHPRRWAIGLIALLTVALIACGGAEQPTSAPVSKKAEDVQLAPTVGILATSVPAAAEPTAAPEPTLGAVMTAKDTVRIITSEEANTLGASSNNCVGNIPNTICAHGENREPDPGECRAGASFEITPEFLEDGPRGPEIKTVLDADWYRDALTLQAGQAEALRDVVPAEQRDNMEFLFENLTSTALHLESIWRTGR